MSKQEQKNQVNNDVIVVAREGYSVLLEIDGRTFDIDCHESINLSNIFHEDILKRCSSLNTHLKDGNLIYFKEGTNLSVDINVVPKIKLMREEAAQHIVSQYEQTEKNINRTNMELETRSNITENTRKHIQEQVQESKKNILKIDQKILAKTVDNVNDATGPRKERQHAMTANELTMGVTMDINPTDFQARQKAVKAKFDATGQADEAAADNEIARQDAANAENPE